jgi:hypothetical protein
MPEGKRISFHIPEEVWKALSEAFYDPFLDRPQYGAIQKLGAQLFQEWLRSREKRNGTG